MQNTLNAIQELLQQRAEYQARLRLIPYDGTPEVKDRNGQKYLYMRKRTLGKLTSTYVNAYSDELYQLLLRNVKEAKDYKKQIRRIEKELAMLGYTEQELSPQVLLNLDFARANMKASIYDQAVLEGVATTFPQTENIIDNGIVNGMTATDVQKILNLKHAWEFILDKDMLLCPTDYYLVCHIARLVNEGFFRDGGRLRGVPVAIGVTSYMPPLPLEADVKDTIASIVSPSAHTKADWEIETAIQLCLYCMKAQLFNDGNKRAAVILANHFLISKGKGLLIIPEQEVPQFKKLLVAYYEGTAEAEIIAFMKSKCWKTF